MLATLRPACIQERTHLVLARGAVVDAVTKSTFYGCIRDFERVAQFRSTLSYVAVAKLLYTAFTERD